FAISACVIFSRAAISFSLLSSACCTCHSLASAADSPILVASSSGFLAIIGLILGIENLFEAFPGQFDLQRGRLLRLLHECMEDENAARRGGVVKHPQCSVVASYTEFRDTCGDSRDRPGVRHSDLLPDLQPKQTLS